MRFRLAFAVVLLLHLVGGRCFAQAPSILQNGDFAAGPQKPASWSTFAHEGKYTVALDGTGGPKGAPCLKVEGTAEADGGRAGALQKTDVFEAPKGLHVQVRTQGEEGRRAVVLQFFDERNPREIAEMVSLPIQGEDADFREFSADVAVPAKLRGCKIAVNFMLYLYGTGSCKWADAALTPLARIEPKLLDNGTEPTLLQPSPRDSSVAPQNPPDFRWRPEKWAQTYTLQLCQGRDFAGPTLLTFEGIRYNCFNLSQTLAPSAWFWRYSFVTDDGEKSDWSAVRSFSLPEGVPTFILPPIEEVKRRIGGEHPRLYVRRADLEGFRRRKDGEAKDWWEGYQKGLDRLLTAEPAPEPVDADLTKIKRPMDLDYFKVDTRLRQAAGQVTSSLWNLAFGYLVTGEGKYADGAKKYLLHVSRWDPNGATSFASNDQVFRDIAIKSAMAYDWIYETLRDDERRFVQKMLLARGQELYRRYAGTNWRVLNYPYDSHGQTNIGYLGLITLSVAGDIPEADEWLDYTVKVYCNSFPPWGAEDGGWSQGVSYWKWSCFMSFQYVDALRTATGIDLYQKPWFRENGWFKLHFQPPWCKLSHFGDTGPSGPDAADANDLAHYAAVYRNPYSQWYADSVRRSPDNSPYGYFFYDPTVKPRPPADLPQYRCSRDIGWVAMHSALYRPDDVMLFAKSSWYGSQSHSHADQNSFVIYAFGEPLAIDSGYYPWYGSPHHTKWAQQSKAHNTVLVDGEGQPSGDITAKGETLDFLGGRAYTYWLGEAAGAYRGRLKKFQRHIVHLRPDAFVIYDDLEAAQPATFQWLLHGLNEMEIDPATQSVLVRAGDASLAVEHLLPRGLSQTQSDKFEPPPEARGPNYPNQWHYTAATTAKAQAVRFLTLLHAFAGRGGSRAAPTTTGEVLPGDSAVGLKVAEGDRVSVIAFAAGAAGAEVAADRLAFNGKLAAHETVADRVSRFMLVGGDRLRTDSRPLVESDTPVSLSAGWIGGIFDCKVLLKEDSRLRLYLGRKPAFLHDGGKPVASADWSFDPASGCLSLALKAGEHSLEAFIGEVPKATEARESPPCTECGSAVTANNTQVAWGRIEAKPGVYRVKLDGAGDVWLDAEKLSPDKEVFLQAHVHFLVETPLGATIPTISLDPLYTAEKAVSAIVVRESDPRLTRALKTEAESYAEGIRGNPMIYSHRTFLSGGKGVSTPPMMGVGARWKIEVPKDGRFEVVLKVATHEESAVRAIAIDGRPVFGDHFLVRFPNTGGFGADPAEWKHYAVAGPDGKPLSLELKAGPHVIEIVSVEGLLNLDCLWFAPP